MIVKLTYLDCFDSEFNGETYKIYQFANLLTFDLINGVNLVSTVKLIPNDTYKCTIERKGRKWRVTEVNKLD